jgi:hypothetical protein
VKTIIHSISPNERKCSIPLAHVCLIQLFQTGYVESKSADKQLGSRLLEIGDQIVPILVLLEAAKGHFSPGDVFLGIL